MNIAVCKLMVVSEMSGVEGPERTQSIIQGVKKWKKKWKKIAATLFHKLKTVRATPPFILKSFLQTSGNRQI